MRTAVKWSVPSSAVRTTRAHPLSADHDAIALVPGPSSTYRTVFPETRSRNSTPDDPTWPSHRPSGDNAYPDSDPRPPTAAAGRRNCRPVPSTIIGGQSWAQGRYTNDAVPTAPPGNAFGCLPGVVNGSSAVGPAIRSPVLCDGRSSSTPTAAETASTATVRPTTIRAQRGWTS